MTQEEKDVAYVNNRYLEKRDNRVSKPDIWLSESESLKNITHPNNWALKWNDNFIMMDKPNDVAIYSTIANNALIDSKAFYDENLQNPNLYFLKNIMIDEQKKYYDYFQKVIMAIIFSYTAAESFANLFIPENYEIIKTENSGVKKIWNKSAIERTYTLRDKFKEVLSKTLNTPDPAKQTWWNDFLLLENIRNEIIHSKASKSQERYSSLLNKEIFNIINSHNEVIKFYGNSIKEHEDRYLINEFPYGFGFDEVTHYIVEDDEFDEITKEIGNHKF